MGKVVATRRTHRQRLKTCTCNAPAQRRWRRGPAPSLTAPPRGACPTERTNSPRLGSVPVDAAADIDPAVFAATDVIDINDGKDVVAAGRVGGAVAMRVVDRLGDDALQYAAHWGWQGPWTTTPPRAVAAVPPRSPLRGCCYRSCCNSSGCILQRTPCCCAWVAARRAGLRAIEVKVTLRWLLLTTLQLSTPRLLVKAALQRTPTAETHVQSHFTAATMGCSARQC